MNELLLTLVELYDAEELRELLLRVLMEVSSGQVWVVQSVVPPLKVLEDEVVEM